jgi:hypothetical protein
MLIGIESFFIKRKHMDIEIERGRRVSLLPNEMTPLEFAIARFEKQAKAYYSKKQQARTETPAERLKREKELASALTHLKNERKRVAILKQIQIRLEAYQGWGRQKAAENPFELLEEKHHPTTVLARNMRADGRPQPSQRHSPHHIVQGKGKHPRTADVRLNLHLYGIRINDPSNGVWMPRTKADRGHWSMPGAPAHSEIHTFNYETWINFLLAPLEGEEVIRAALMRIRCLLRDGKQPKQVTAKKNANWRPTL